MAYVLTGTLDLTSTPLLKGSGLGVAGKKGECDCPESEEAQAETGCPTETQLFSYRKWRYQHQARPVDTNRRAGTRSEPDDDSQWHQRGKRRDQCDQEMLRSNHVRFNLKISGAHEEVRPKRADRHGRAR